MFRISLKSTLARKGRLLLTSLAVIAGCAFLSGVFVFSDTIRGSFDRLFANAYENTDAFVRSSNVIEADFGAESRDRIPDSTDRRGACPAGRRRGRGRHPGLRPHRDVRRHRGRAGRPAEVRRRVDRLRRTRRGISPRASVPPTAPRWSSIAARRRKATSPSATPCRSPASAASATSPSSGIATFAGADTSGGATWALFDLPTAQDFVIGQPGLVDSIVVVGDGSVTDDELADTDRAAVRQPGHRGAHRRGDHRGEPDRGRRRACSSSRSS